MVPAVGQRWRGQRTAFVAPERRLDCTLVAWWGEGYTDPGFLLTELAPEGCEAAWYGVRSWGEQGVKCFKRGGWQWQYTQMSAPDRAARRWLAVAVATLWMVRVGGALEVYPPPDAAALPALQPLLGDIVATPGRPAPPPVAALGLVVVPRVSDYHRRAANAATVEARALARTPCWGAGGCVPSEHLGIQL